MLIRKNFLLAAILLATVFAFAKKATIWQQDTSKPKEIPTTEFETYWQQKGQESIIYTISDGVHTSEATLNFELIDFRTDKYVKLSSDHREKAVSVLALNSQFQEDKFSTNCSVFTPTDAKLFPHSLKIMASTHEPAGNSYKELLAKSRVYELLGSSYTEADANQKGQIDRNWSEDELWTKIRTNPAKLPTGNFKIILGLGYANKQHLPIGLHDATAKIDTIRTDSSNYSLRYALQYPSLKRNLNINFGSTWPYSILGWEDIMQGAVVKAVIKK